MGVRGYSLVLALAVVAVAATARADDYIDITPSGFKPLPVAVDQTGGEPGPSKEFTDTLRFDLAISGYFEVLDPRSYPNSAKDGTSVNQIDFSGWRAVGASNVTKARLNRVGGDLVVEAWLYDAIGPGEMLHVRLTGPSDSARTLSHRWANAIVKRLTGTEGFFLTRIAYVHPSGHNTKDVWVSDLDGRNAVDLTPGGSLNLLPAWSPNGRTVVFTSFRDGSPMLYLVDSLSRGFTSLPHRGSLETGGAFSPDGKRIAFSMADHGAANIFIVNADGSDVHALTNGRETNTSPCWSPDGKRIAFVSTRSGDPQIFVMNADGTNVRRLTFQGRYNQTPDWSPRGDEILFTARDERNVFDIFAVKVDNSQVRRLTQDQGFNEEPAWAPNGAAVLFTSNRTGRSTLWVMNKDGTNQRQLLNVEAYTPAWGPIP